MKALVVTITKQPWPSELTRHWHLVHSSISSHVVGAVEAVYGNFAEVEEYEWDGYDNRPICRGCGERIGR